MLYAPDLNHFPTSFLQLPLTPAAALARRIHAQQAGKLSQLLHGIDHTEWVPMTDRVPETTRFTITRHDTTNASFPNGAVYFVAVAPEGTVKPNVFGLTSTPAEAEYLAGIYMAAPTPSARYGYLHFEDVLQPVVWANKAAKARFFKSLIL